MSRYNSWTKAGLGAAFLVVLAVPAALHAVTAVPASPIGPLPPAKVAADNRFVPACKATEVADTRPDPAWVGESFERDNCWAPQKPAPLDGFTASRDQIVAGMEAAKRYAAQSDTYQQCIAGFVSARKAAADKGKNSLNVSLITIENHRIIASEENKKQVTNQIEVAINAFNEYGSDCPE